MKPKNRRASPELRNRFGTNLRRLRTAKGYTQLELAHRSGLTNCQINKMEQGRLNSSLAALEALSVALECWEVDLLWPIKEKERHGSQEP